MSWIVGFARREFPHSILCSGRVTGREYGDWEWMPGQVRGHNVFQTKRLTGISGWGKVKVNRMLILQTALGRGEVRMYEGERIATIARREGLRGVLSVTTSRKEVQSGLSFLDGYAKQGFSISGLAKDILTQALAEIAKQEDEEGDTSKAW